MDLKENLITKDYFLYLIRKQEINPIELKQLICFPFVPLSLYLGDVSKNEEPKIKKIEDINILYFFNSLRICFDKASSREMEIFKKNLVREPLLTAVNLTKLKINPIDKYITFIETSCKILISMNSKGKIESDNPFEIKIVGGYTMELLKI